MKPRIVFKNGEWSIDNLFVLNCYYLDLIEKRQWNEFNLIIKNQNLAKIKCREFNERILKWQQNTAQHEQRVKAVSARLN